jgi:hypothetical protein
MGKQSTRAPVRSAGVMGTARWKGDAGNRGDPLRARVAASTSLQAAAPQRESDRVIVLVKPGNSGGRKDPDFWSADEEGEDQVIGNEP